MRKKFLKAACLVVSVALLSINLGACGKESSTPSTKTGKTASATKATSSSTAGKTSAKTNSTTKTAASTSSANKPSTTLSAGSSSSDVNSPGNEIGETNNEYVSNPSSDGNSSTPGETALDLQGRKLVVAIRASNPPDPTTSVINSAFISSIKNAEKKYNTTVEWRCVPGGTGVIAGDFLNEVTAGLHFADVVELACKVSFPTMPEKGLIAPIDDYIDYSSPLYNTENITTSGLWKGKNYGFMKPVDVGGFGVFYNKDIFEREGYGNIKEIVDSGNWTWDTFLQVAQAATKDMNGDGVVDQWGIEMHKDDYPGSAFVFSNGADFFEYTDGKVVFTLSETRAAKALQFMSDLINTYKVMTPLLPNSAWKQGTAAMYMGGSVSAGSGYKSILNCGFLPLPKGPDVQDYQIAGFAGSMYSFPSTGILNENIPVFLDMMTVWDPAKEEHVTIDDYTRDTAEKHFQEEDRDFILKYYTDRRVSQYQSFGTLQTLIKNEVFNKIATRETTPASALDAVMIPAQQILDDLIDTQ